MKKSLIFISLFATCLAMASCEKVDPFVDRVVSPVLILVESSDGSPSSGLTTDPTVTAPFGSAATIGVRVLSLDKTNILDYTKGIDSIPVSSLELKLKMRGGSEIGTFTTDANGRATIALDWSTLGVSSAGKSVSLAASGSYDNVSFTKLFKVSAK